ncbi:CvpA family protein [Halocynthiibacter sp. C4]|uniref:CvpA family protein n=1 Tax=Halocynthiibacter sp. C4 TaxID=2992758 RepID=UPI00237C5100|nr:CvpA family protein [Halocynthiibacter sp. C4]MDE0589290.1 CvpA family protein [Halocynthiibacter sp. C4]
MEGFTIVDGAVAVVILISALLAYSRGLVRETLSIASWIAAAVIAYIFAPKAEPLVREIPILNDFIGGQCELSLGASFAIVGIVALVVLSIFTPIFSNVVQRSVLGGLDQGLGFLFGAARGALLVAVALWLYNWAVTDEPIAVIEDSRSAEVFGQLSDRVGNAVPTDVPGWLETNMEEFLAQCEPATETTVIE